MDYKNYKVELCGEIINDGTPAILELGMFDTFEEARSICDRLNNFLRDDLKLIFHNIMEWRLNILSYAGDGMYEPYCFMNGNNNKLKQD